MKRLLIPFRTFFEIWFGTCDIYVNSRGQLNGEVHLFWFKPRSISCPAESTISSKFIQLATYTPPALLTRIHYVLPTTQPQSPDNTPTVHIPIKPLAPTS